MSERGFDRLVADLGELLARQERGRGRDFGRYRDDAVGFLRDVLGANPWERQREIAEAVRDHPLVTVRSCHAAGKDWLAARLALWWVYARGGLVVLTGPTAAQVEEILMRKELRTAFVAGNLPGELHVRALRPGGSGEAGIIARTGRDTHAMTGLHDALVLYIITEAQDPEIAHAWDAAFACTTGEHDRVLTLGNPTVTTGKFFNAHRSGSGWHAVKIDSDDIPNVRHGRTVIPGLLTREGRDRFIKEYGADSPVVASRLHAEFPDDDEAALVLRAWIDAAVARWRPTHVNPYEPATVPLVLGVNVARMGTDSTVVCLRRGATVERFTSWRGHDTMQTADRIEQLVKDLIGGGSPVSTVAIDEIGVGAGVADRLRDTLHELFYFKLKIAQADMSRRRVRVHAFNASASAKVRERFVNARAETYWAIRRLLEEERLALPDDPVLIEELLATTVRFDSSGRVQVESKDDIKRRIGRSPDRADALAISLAPTLSAVAKKKRRARWR